MDKPDHCPNCQAEDYSWHQVKPGQGDPSQTYCVCNQCEHEFDGATEND
jgi:DNA-directed RNA polymerase subunit M/transcription elongation factor TFIIS